MQTETETPTLTFTPTETQTPSVTPTPTATFTATPDFYIEVTLDPTAYPNESARIVREVSSADMWVILLLFAILVSIWAMWIVNRFTGGR